MCQYYCRHHFTFCISLPNLGRRQLQHAQQRNSSLTLKLHNFAEWQNVELLLKLLSYEGSTGLVDVNQRTGDGGNETALHLVCSNICNDHGSCFIPSTHNPHLAVLLLAHSGHFSGTPALDVDAVSGKDGCTPLQKLCKNISTAYDRAPLQPGNDLPDQIIAAVQLLITFGASLTVPNAKTGKTALEFIAESAATPVGWHAANNDAPRAQLRVQVPFTLLYVLSLPTYLQQPQAVPPLLLVSHLSFLHWRTISLTEPSN